MDASLADPEEGREEDEVAGALRVMKVVEDEMQAIINDDPELAAEEMRILGRLKKMAEIQSENEEILQTKIISAREVVRNWSEWIPAVKSEVESLTIEKGALKELTKEEVLDLKRQVEENGKKLEVIPSKMVFTIKPSAEDKSGKKKGEMGSLRQSRREERGGGKLFGRSRCHDPEAVGLGVKSNEVDWMHFRRPHCLPQCPNGPRANRRLSSHPAALHLERNQVFEP